MRKLSETQSEAKANLVCRLRAHQEAVTQAVHHFNNRLEEENKQILEVLTRYNEVAEEAAEFVSSIAKEAEEAWNEKSETFQESAAGQSIQDFFQEWQDAILGEVEVDLPGALDEPDMPDAENLESLPEEAE